MPWLRKYRVFHEERLLQALQSLHIRHEEAEEDSKPLPQRVKEDIEDDISGVKRVIADNLLGSPKAEEESA